MPYKLLYRRMDTNGDGTGTKSVLADYDGSPTLFSLTAQPAEHIIIQRVLVSLEADSFANSDLYGSGPKLDNGISMYVTDSMGVIQYYLTEVDHPVTTNGEWAHVCYDFNRFSTDFPQGNEYAAARWTFGKSGQPVELLPGWSICLLAQDDFTEGTSGLIEHGFLLQGYYLQPPIGTDPGHA